MNSQIIQNTILFVQEKLEGAEGGHDWFHIERVWRNSKLIAQSENVNMLIVELGALLHDIADSKFNDGDETIGPKIATEFMESQGIDSADLDHVIAIIENISFKGGNQAQKFTSPELNVVQDADRLDALGAIGIARAFNYGGFKNREIYNPSIAPKLNMSIAEYKASTDPSINHFYEKLLLLKDRMNTKTGQQLAQERQKFMELYLKQFYGEWNGDI